MAAERGRGHADLSWNGISCTVAGLRRNIGVLKEISGRVGGGKGGSTGVCALLGPSGAGKSTLLNILAGRANAGRISGTVQSTGAPCALLNGGQLPGTFPRRMSFREPPRSGST